ncbi:subtilisin-like protease 1 [Triticum dicoccoides]|uniref:subtilisin-like protease 1 n=1 Tax=Triticum dicoccoides TaxID=85692 RepID=UPI0018908093|nr:subtilisin-like protease 1 [Triticum dicoccoides]
METTRLSLLSLLPFLLLAIAAEATGGELSTYIVHVQAEENRVFGTPDDRKTWYHSFLPEHGRLVHAYHHVASGFAARLTRPELEAVSAMPGFLSATRARTYTTLTTHTPEFLGLNLEQGRRNYTSEFGAGVIVGVIDSGIFPDHPSFSDDGMPPPPAKWKGRCDFNRTSCNNKLIGARNFVSTLNDPNGTSARVPPIDDFGHGTHTASTAAGAVVPGANVLGHALGTAAGMAARAHIAMYKVCDLNGGCKTSDMLAGVDAAVGDGCDVISMSLAGPSVAFHLDPMAIGTFGAIEKGIFLGNGAYFQGESLYQPNAGVHGAFYPLVSAGASGKPLAEFCGNGSLDGFDVKGKIVLCELTRNITAMNQGQVVLSAGGLGMILANQFAQGYDTLADENVLPSSSVDYLASAAIKLYLSSTANPVAHIGFRGTVLGTSPAPSIVYFSSRGPSRQGTGVLKPDITGPGVNVLAAWPFQIGPPSAPVLPGPTFNIISGTSMSTPHLAGIAALIKSKHPDWSPAAIKSAMMTTADITDRSGNPILNEQRVAANLFATGAGHVNPMKAADPGLVYDITPEDYIGYLCSMYTSQQVSVIARRPIDCLTTVVISDRLLNYPSISVAFPASWNSTAPVVVRRKVKNVGEVPSVYYAAIDMPSSAVSVDVYPTELEFIEANQEVIFSVYVWPRQIGARVVQGALRWVSEKHIVRSPISVTFA